MGRLRVLITLIVIVAGVYVGYRVVPIYYSNFAFQNELDTLALNASYSRKSETELRDMVIRKALDYDIPLTEDQVNVQRNGPDLLISAQYTRHVDVPIHPFDLSFSPSTKNHVP